MLGIQYDNLHIKTICIKKDVSTFSNPHTTINHKDKKQNAKNNRKYYL